MIHRISSWQKEHDAIREIESVRSSSCGAKDKERNRERERERKWEKEEGYECVYPRHISIRKMG